MTKGTIQFKGESITFSTKDVTTIYKETNIPYSPCTRIKFQQITDLNVLAKLESWKKHWKPSSQP